MSRNLLIERINAVEYLGNTYKNANFLHDRKLEIINFREVFETLVPKIKTLSANHKALTGICDLDTIEIQAILVKYKKIIRSMEKDIYRTEDITEIKNSIDEANRQMVNLWKQYVLKRTKPIDNVLDALGEIIDYSCLFGTTIL